MAGRFAIWGGLGIVAVALSLGAGWIFSLPRGRTADPAPVPQAERTAMLDALKPRRQGRPLVAIVGINDATETTDYVMSYGVLRRADVADVVALATKPGRVKLFPALQVEPQATIADFDAQHPDGADYVIVPAMSRDDDPVALDWIRAQAAKGAMAIGVCAGAKVVAASGLLDGKRATTHWYYLKDLRSKHPTVRYVADRRIVVDGRVATTTGISASMPMALTLVEAIAGRDKAEALARSLGRDAWDESHDSGAFALTRPFATTVLRNALQPWTHEQFGLPLQAGVDEVSLALVADAWSRTYRSRASTFAPSGEPQTSRNGLRIIPDLAVPLPPDRLTPGGLDGPPAVALDRALGAIAERYGAATAGVVAVQMEYPTKQK